MKIVIPPRAGHFSTLHLLASLQRRNSRFALKQSSLRALRCGGRVPRKISNARFRDPIFKFRKGLKTAQASGKEDDYVTGANIDGFTKVANAMLACGVV